MSLNSSRALKAVLIAVFLGVATVTSAPSYGAIVFTKIELKGNVSGSIGSNGVDTIFVEKVYDQFEPIFIEFFTDPLFFGQVTIEEMIVNRTGIDWLDFHFEIVGAESVLVALIEPFTIADVTSTAVWLSGGTVSGVGQSFGVLLGLNITGDNLIIEIQQFPTVPIPAALWLFGSGLNNSCVAWGTREHPDAQEHSDKYRHHPSRSIQAHNPPPKFFPLIPTLCT